MAVSGDFCISVHSFQQPQSTVTKPKRGSERGVGIATEFSVLVAWGRAVARIAKNEVRRTERKAMTVLIDVVNLDRRLLIQR
tara:strand:+ start:24742 stop:24987 length:246 start_codon:yes stop_codon:yes gene_type:complete